MTAERQRAIEIIRAAFKGVVLGNGIGLHEGDGIDDYADKATLKAYRGRDEKIDWEAITSKSLNDHYCSLSYFDAEGMRFHLPAFMIADLKDELGNDIFIYLKHSTDYGLNQFSLLSPIQRAAVREYLLILKNNPHEVDRPLIEEALENYWTAD